MVFVPAIAAVGTLAEAAATVDRLRTFSTSSRVRVLAERAVALRLGVSRADEEQVGPDAGKLAGDRLLHSVAQRR
jgi:hypothetical protein